MYQLPKGRARLLDSIVAAGLVIALTARPAAAQDTTVSATMLRVLAEAADGFRTGRPIYLVADRRFPHNVAGPFPSRAAAERVRADSGATFAVFGPYLTRPDPAPRSAPRVVAVRITVEQPGGRRRTFDVRPDSIDALFFTLSAVDKFMVPYYTRIYGTEYAHVLRETVMRQAPPCHGFSRPCMPDTLGMLMMPIWDPARGPVRPAGAPGR